MPHSGASMMPHSEYALLAATPSRIGGWKRCRGPSSACSVRRQSRTRLAPTCLPESPLPPPRLGGELDRRLFRFVQGNELKVGVRAAMAVAGILRRNPFADWNHADDTNTLNGGPHEETGCCCSDLLDLCARRACLRSTN